MRLRIAFTVRLAHFRNRAASPKSDARTRAHSESLREIEQALDIASSLVRNINTFGFTPSDLRQLRALKTPAGVQKFLDDLPYNLSFTARSPKRFWMIARRHVSKAEFSERLPFAFWDFHR